MNNFCLCSIFVRAASVSHCSEPQFKTHTGAAQRLSHNPHPTTRPRGADLTFVRHKRPSRTPNPITTSNLPLCAKKHRISPPCVTDHSLLPRAFPTPHNLRPPVLKCQLPCKISPVHLPWSFCLR